ncbi:hypothetical protein B0H13DRAFT_2300704 [Mycena leptocephala]|nr:hypothetical protein B0H13DRAFT_2300704 [Mycena leptocephala]
MAPTPPLSDTQPFNAFLENSANPAPAPAIVSPPAGILPVPLPARDGEPLSADLKISLGPSSATRSLTRTSTAPAALMTTPKDMAPNGTVNTFEWPLAPSIILLCLGTIDTRVEKLSRTVTNFITETELRAAAHTRTLDDLQGRVPRSPPPFSIGQLSDAMKQQLGTITNDRDKLAARIESSTSKQLKINKAHDDDLNRLHEEVRALKATITRLELAPPAPLSLDTHSTSVSQHPLTAPFPAPPPSARSFTLTIPLRKSPRCQALPPHIGRDRDGSHQIRDGITVAAEHYEVRREGDYLLVRLPSAADARALIKAWAAHTPLAGPRRVQRVGKMEGQETTIAVTREVAVDADGRTILAVLIFQLCWNSK